MTYDRLLLIGMMGVGKTTVGMLLAERLGWGYLDSDVQVAQATGHSVADIFSEDGEGAIRVQETRALMGAVSSRAPMVISVAGGAVLSEENRALLSRSGVVVWLRARPETSAERIGDGHERPPLGDDPAAALSALYEVRAPFYEKLASVTVDVDDLSPEAVAERVLGDRVLIDALDLGQAESGTGT
jgi:shikimate kinase